MIVKKQVVKHLAVVCQFLLTFLYAL